MNALEFLKEDHRKVKTLFQEMRKTSDRSKQKEIFDKIDTELEMHTHIEETIFYPAIEEQEELKDMVTQALAEHHQAKELLEQLETLRADDHDFGSKLQQLMEAVEHHVEEEEEEMFPKIREVFDEDELEQLGEDLESAKGAAHRKAG
jgi:hemerythrin superfamily protein